jgi:hypothetical protein
MNDFEIGGSASRRGRRSGMVLIVCIVCFWFAGIGLVHVLTKNRIYALGREQRQLENEIVVLKQELRSQDLLWEEARTRKNLMDKLVVNRSKLRAIQPSSIVRLDVKNAPPVASENK